MVSKWQHRYIKTFEGTCKAIQEEAKHFKKEDFTYYSAPSHLTKKTNEYMIEMAALIWWIFWFVYTILIFTLGDSYLPLKIILGMIFSKLQVFLWRTTTPYKFNEWTLSKTSFRTWWIYFALMLIYDFVVITKTMFSVFSFIFVIFEWIL